MYFKNLSHPPGPQVFLTESLRFLEDKFAVVITIHDCFGKISNPDGDIFLDRYLRHRHPFCRLLRKDSAAWNAECIKNCLYRAESYARKQQKPFLHQCWKGAWELLVPVQQNGVLQFLFYAGVFRKKEERVPETLPAPVRKRYYDLPVREGRELKELACLIMCIGHSLLHCSMENLPEPEYDRHSMLRHKIRIFLSERIGEPIRLGDLADALCLSETRTSHLVKRLFAVPFQTLVEDERINRALNLLRDPELPLKIIAEKTGFRNEFYFSRVFRRHCGAPPGRYRKTCAAVR